MKIAILGGGWYGAHLSSVLVHEHDVELHEIREDFFMGASGSNPARLHLGFHYPRSALTRAHCLAHNSSFMAVYGPLTEPVFTNIYAVAAEDSNVDYGTYLAAMRQSGVPLLEIDRPDDWGLRNVEGAVLTGERHIVIDRARAHFRTILGHCAVLQSTLTIDDLLADFDLIIDCTFSALTAADIDRYEPCITGILKGDPSIALTIMDGPFPSIYPWDQRFGLSSITSALHTPLSKQCHDYEIAQVILSSYDERARLDVVDAMVRQIAQYWPAVFGRYEIAGAKVGIRAMPKSKSDARLCTVKRDGDKVLRVRAGKIDAIFHAEALVAEAIREMDV